MIHAQRLLAFVLSLAAVILTNASTGAISVSAKERLPDQPMASTSVIVDRIGDFDYDDQSFNATFWIQSATNANEGNPLEGLEFANSIDPPSVDKTSQSRNGDIQIYRMLVSGTFHHTWGLTNYPFDRETLQLIIRDSRQSVGLFKQQPDERQSGLRQIPDQIGEWRIKGFQLSEESTDSAANGYLTTPGLEQNKNESSLVFSIKLVNAHGKGAFKLLASGLVAAAIAAMSYTLEPNTSQRYGSLTASLFAAVLGMRSAYSYLGNIHEITYIEYIYLLIMIQIIFSFGFSSYLGQRAKEQQFKDSGTMTYSIKAGVISTTVLVALIAVTTINAVMAG